MSVLRGCLIPEEFFYLVDRHVWVSPPVDGVVRVGITPAGFILAGGKPVAITFRRKQFGQEIARGRSVAVMESSKWAGGIPAPLPGRLLGGNPAVEQDPSLAVTDSYGAGWLVEMAPTDWVAAQLELLTGQAAMTAYEAVLVKEGITCE
jgi:glycine cleavage system H protein